MKQGKWEPEPSSKPVTVVPAVVPNRLQQPAETGRPRQAAITRNLHTWSNYKNWAEKMKDSFDGEKPKP
jgi:hypothetical protein